MTDESFFDANGEVRPDGVNNLVPDLAIQKPRRHITLNAAGIKLQLSAYRVGSGLPYAGIIKYLLRFARKGSRADVQQIGTKW